MKGWRRQYWFDETGLPWMNPSPNMRNLIQATLYPVEYRLGKEANLLGSETALSHILAGEDPAGVVQTWKADEKQWRHLRGRYLLY
jgi:uncharacterized protein YbbC (DUF1343 family)